MCVLGATTYDLHDGLGSAVKQTGSGASVTATRIYDAFGMPLASTGAPQGPFGFAATSGYQEDGDAGLKLLGHRYYDPSAGRFLTRDPAQAGRNWYAYCDENPLQTTDPTGHFAWVLALLALPALPEIVVGVAVTVIVVSTVVIVGELYDRVTRSDPAPDYTDYPDTVPNTGPPGQTLRGPRTSRQYGPDGFPQVDRDYNKPGTGHSSDEVHDWEPRARGRLPHSSARERSNAG